VETLKLTNLTVNLKKLVVKFLNDYTNRNLRIKDKSYSNQQDSYFKPGTENFNLILNNFLCGNELAHPYSIDSGTQKYSFKIGDVIVRNPVITAPLAGISDNTYRIFASYFGAALNFTEMVTGYGIHYGHRKSFDLSMITGYERPCALQLFGSDADIIADAALKLEDRADIIDINMGCPVPKVLKSGSGGYLMRDEDKVERLIKRVSAVLTKPLTVKTRIGWDRSNINILNIAKIAENAGARAISIHGRTVKQGFTGKADYEILKKVKESVKIPVIASGDIDSSEKAEEVLNYTGCDGVMIGRKAKGRLWFLMDVLIYLLAGKSNLIIDNDFEPDIEWKKEFAKLYLEFIVYFKGEDRGVKEFRKHLCWIFKGLQGVNKIRYEFFKISDFRGAVNCIEMFGK